VNHFVINLDRASARLAHIRQAFDSINLRFVRFSAVDGSRLTTSERSLVPPRQRSRSWTAGELGCLLSHYRLWLTIAAETDRLATIFEDDILVDPSCKDVLAKLEKSDARIDIVKLDTYSSQLVEVEPTPVADVVGLALFRLRSLHYGSGAYVISRDAAATLASRIAEFDEPVDHVLFGRHRASRGLTVLQAVPAIAAQSDHLPDASTRPHLAGSLQAERETAKRARKRGPLLLRLCRAGLQRFRSTIAWLRGHRRIPLRCEHFDADTGQR
jgi:glycosyl transferase family 25